jgi:hypothetical protein
LVNLCFQRGGVVGTWVERSEKRGRTRQISFGLRDSCLEHEGIYVVRYNIKNLIKLSQCFRKAPKVDVGKRALGEQVNVARVEPLGFVEV